MEVINNYKSKVIRKEKHKGRKETCTQNKCPRENNTQNHNHFSIIIAKTYRRRSLLCTDSLGQ